MQLGRHAACYVVRYTVVQYTQDILVISYDINLVSVHGSFEWIIEYFNYQAVWNSVSLQNHPVTTTIEWLLHFQALLNLYEKR